MQRDYTSVRYTDIYSWFTFRTRRIFDTDNEDLLLPLNSDIEEICSFLSTLICGGSRS